MPWVRVRGFGILSPLAFHKGSPWEAQQTSSTCSSFELAPGQVKENILSMSTGFHSESSKLSRDS